MTTTKNAGSKYDRSLRTTEIAALVRAEIKAALKAGELPAGLKVSIRSDSFSGGTAIRVNVTAVPEGFEILNRETLALDLADPHTFRPEFMYPRLNTAAKELLGKISEMFAAYNYDNSDSQRDHFDVNFYDGDAKFDHDLEAADRAAFVASRSAAPAPAAPVAAPSTNVWAELTAEELAGAAERAAMWVELTAEELEAAYQRAEDAEMAALAAAPVVIRCAACGMGASYRTASKLTPMICCYLPADALREEPVAQHATHTDWTEEQAERAEMAERKVSPRIHEIFCTACGASSRLWSGEAKREPEAFVCCFGFADHAAGGGPRPRLRLIAGGGK